MKKRHILPVNLNNGFVFVKRALEPLSLIKFKESHRETTLFKSIIALFSFLLSCLHIQPAIARNINHHEKESLYFVENKGQIHDQNGQKRNDIDFVLRAKGMQIFVGAGTLHYQFYKNIASVDCPSESSCTSPMKRLPSNAETESYRLDVTLQNANKTATITPDGRERYFENYYNCCGDKPIIHVNSYKLITYKNILPNIDWTVKCDGDGLSSEFIVHPGGDPQSIRFQYNGQTSLAINDTDGSIVATTPMGMVKEHAPVCYTDTRVPVAAKYQLDGNTLSFLNAGYSGALVIDPYLEWGTYYGIDTSATLFYDICSDNQNVYACGYTYTYESGFIATSGSFQMFYGGNEDGFIVKFDSSGNRIWGSYLGGSQIDWASAITTDHKGNIYVAGSSASDSGIATPGTSEPTLIGGQWDAFLARFDTNGNRLWGTYVGGTDSPYFDIEVAAVVCDTMNHIYVGGACDDIDHIATPGCWKFHKTEGVNLYDCFLMQFDTTGNKNWGTYYGGNKDDFDGVCSTDGYYVYLGGYTASDTGIASDSSYQPNLYNANSDAFLAKFTPSGSRVWGTYYGGEGQETTGGIAVSGTEIYMFGTTGSDTNMASAGCFQPLRGGLTDGFLALFDPVAGVRIWGTYYGGPGDERTTYSRIAVDSSQNVYVAGYTTSTSGIATPDAWQQFYGGGASDVMVAKYNYNGIQIWSSYYGGSGDDVGTGVAFDGWGVYVVGNTTSPDSMVTPAAFLDSGGGYTFYSSGFMGKIAPGTLKINPENENDFNLYPSPNHGLMLVSGKLSVPEGTAVLQVTDITGRIVLDEKALISNQMINKTLQLPENATPGLYFARIVAGAYTRTIKFVKI